MHGAYSVADMSMEPVSVQQAPALRVLVLERTIDRAEIGSFLGEAFRAAGAVIAAAGSHPAGGPVARYDMSDGQFTVQAGLPISDDLPAPEVLALDVPMTGDLVVEDFPAGPAATTVHTGPYEQVTTAYRELSSWMTEHHYRPSGRPWEQYLDGPEVPQPRTVVWWPCAKD